MKKLIVIICISALMFSFSQAIQAAGLSIPMSLGHWAIVPLAAQQYTNLYPQGATLKEVDQGLEFTGSGYRQGTLLESAGRFNLNNSNIYLKWQANGGYLGAGSQSGPRWFSNPIENNDYMLVSVGTISPLKEAFTTHHSWNNSIVAQPETWYYTRIGIDSNNLNYSVVTSLNNYDNQGGSIFRSRTNMVFDQSLVTRLENSPILFTLLDNYGGNTSTIIAGEAIIEAPVPEPSTMLLGLLGFAGVLRFRRKK